MEKALTLVFAAIFAVLPSCHDKIVTEVPDTAPESFLSLVNASESGKEYSGIVALASFSKVFFSDGTAIIVPKDLMPIEDCTDSKPKEVRYDEATGHWTVGGVDSGLGRCNGSLRESFPVYSYFTKQLLKIYASNGEAITFESSSPEPEPGPEPPKPYGIPRISIDTQGKAPVLSKDDYVDGTIRVEDPQCYFSDERVFEAAMKIKGRGNSTWGMPKKPYKIKLEEKASILGIAKDKEWVLLANYSDKSLLRNATAMEISRILGFKWTPVMISVEFWLNGEYEGVYTFTEHKKVSKSRVDIDTDDDAFYIELENEDVDEPFWFKTSRYGVTAMVHEPVNPTAEQREYLKKWFEDMETALSRTGHESEPDFTDYRDWLDLQSFVNYYIIEELARNPDGNFRKSTFLTKEKGKKLELYHVWDFDLTMGNCNYFEDSTNPEGWLMKDCVWFNRLFKSKVYVDAVKETLSRHYDELYDVQNFIYDQARLIEGAVDRNFERWPILGTYVWPNCVWFPTYEEELDFFADYYIGRLEWFKRAVDGLN